MKTLQTNITINHFELGTIQEPFTTPEPTDFTVYRDGQVDREWQRRQRFSRIFNGFSHVLASSAVKVIEIADELVIEAHKALDAK